MTSTKILLVMKFTFWALGLSLMFLSSCTRDDAPTKKPKKPVASVFDYYPMKPGNYWVYQEYIIDTTGKEEKGQRRDSLYVVGDSVIGSDTFSHLSGTDVIHGKDLLLRDSAGLLINHKGEVFLSATNFKDTLDVMFYKHDGRKLMRRAGKMTNPSQKIKTPAGSFDVIDFEISFQYLETKVSNGKWYPRIMHNYYTKNVGPVVKSFFYAVNPKRSEMRLVKYHVSVP